jgi:PilZ domain
MNDQHGHGPKRLGFHERRREARYDAMNLPELSARLEPGPAVRLLDISRRGALVESKMLLRPGQPVSLCFVTPDCEVRLTGRAVRTTVSALSETELGYRTGLSFGEDNTLYIRLLELKSADTDAKQADPPVDADQARTPATSVAQNANGLRDLLEINDW